MKNGKKISIVDDLEKSLSKISIKNPHCEPLKINKNINTNDNNSFSNDVTTKCLNKLIPEINNNNITPKTKDAYFIAKVPVVISDFEIQLNCKSKIPLNGKLIKIKNSKNSVAIKECTLVHKCNKLFISGYIRRKIIYNEIKDKKCRTAKLKHFINTIPFECATTLNYCTDPILSPNPPEEKFIIKNNNNITNNINCECLNEPIYYNLINTETHNSILKNKSSSEANTSNNIFNDILVLKLHLRLFQNQLKEFIVKEGMTK